MTSQQGKFEIVHASCVSWNGDAVLIKGPAGSGKSAIALELMAYGALLVADDQTELRLFGDQIIARCPASIHGQIEARNAGILAADTVASARVVLIVDLATTETQRLPPFRHSLLLGQKTPLLHRSVHTHFSAVILQYMKGGRIV